VVFLLTVIVILSIVLSIIRIHYVTNNVNEVSIVWGMVTFILYIINGEWTLALMGSLASAVVVWLLFSLSNYLEDNLLLRIIVLVLTMLSMLITLSFFLKFVK
jgi:hypothetical protein